MAPKLDVQTQKSPTSSSREKPKTNVMRCAIWYYLYNFKNVKNTHGGVLILVQLQAELKAKCKLRKGQIYRKYFIGPSLLGYNERDCVKNVQIWRILVLIFPQSESPYSVRKRKKRTIKNSISGHFSWSESLIKGQGLWLGS